MDEGNLPRRARDFHRRSREFVRFAEEVDKTLRDLETETGGDKEEVLRGLVQRFRVSAQEIEEWGNEAERTLEEDDMIRVEASIEGKKLKFDAVKQQATFSAAGVAGVAAITEAVLPERLQHVYLLWVTYGLLLTTIAVSLLLLYLESMWVERVLGTESLPSAAHRGWRAVRWLYLSALGLLAATVAFIVFAALNL